MAQTFIYYNNGIMVCHLLSFISYSLLFVELNTILWPCVWRKLHFLDIQEAHLAFGPPRSRLALGYWRLR